MAFKVQHLSLKMQIPGPPNLHFNTYSGDSYTTKVLEILAEDKM